MKLTLAVAFSLLFAGAAFADPATVPLSVDANDLNTINAAVRNAGVACAAGVKVYCKIAGLDSLDATLKKLGDASAAYNVAQESADKKAKK